MRIGTNPMKYSRLTIKEAYHRIIIPVYIPSDEGYFEKSYEVLKLCINSLLQTIHDKTLITIINNNCNSDVTIYLRELLELKKIDQLVEYQENKGKVDPVVSVMKGSLESLITITDCDVLFKFGWQNAVETIFSNFPKVGMVSPLPAPGIRHYFSSWSWLFGLINLSIKRKKNNDIESLINFKKSIGLTDVTLNNFEKYPFVLRKKNIEAIIGAGHFCATYNKNIIKYIPESSSGIYFNGAEELFLDKPVEIGRFLRLATSKGYVFHMGNKPENWMYKVLNENLNFKETSQNIVIGKGYNFFLIPIKFIVSNKYSLKLVERLFNR